MRAALTLRIWRLYKWRIDRKMSLRSSRPFTRRKRKIMVKVIIIRTAGTNCNEETAFAFSHLGAMVEQVHINALIAGSRKLGDFHILALPGGFSYGDDIASGRILANELRLRLAQDIKQFINDGKLIIGI